jgi:hypothetical protein
MCVKQHFAFAITATVLNASKLSAELKNKLRNFIHIISHTLHYIGLIVSCNFNVPQTVICILCGICCHLDYLDMATTADA